MTEAEKNELAKVTAAPSYLTEFTGETGTEDVGKFVKPPRLKIVQKQAGSALLENFDIGDLIVTPTNSMMSPMGETFAFAPLFWWPEWCKWNPYELKDQLDTIAERSLDPASDLALRTRNPKLREELYPEKHRGKDIFWRYCEHLNYLVQVLSGPMAGGVIVMSFFKAQHQDGTNFSQLIQMRGKGIPLASMQFEAKSYYKNYGGNDWYGIRISNPQTVEPFATAEEFAARQAMFLEFKEAHDLGKIVVDMDEGPDSVVEGEVVPEAKPNF